MERRRHRKRARDRLARHGFNYKKRCRLTKHAKHCLVPNVDTIGGRVFGGLCRFERMHVYYIGYCSYLLETLIELVDTTQFLNVHQVVKHCHQFRDPHTGATHPRLAHLTKMTHLTAERRVRAVFYWGHVLGTKAEVIHPAVLRLPAQRAVALLQLLLISMRGHRAYTLRELEVIFKQVGVEFFKALEEMSSHLQQKNYDKQVELHDRDPLHYRSATIFQKMKPFVPLCLLT